MREKPRTASNTYQSKPHEGWAYLPCQNCGELVLVSLSSIGCVFCVDCMKCDNSYEASSENFHHQWLRKWPQ